MVIEIALDLTVLVWVTMNCLNTLMYHTDMTIKEQKVQECDATGVDK